MKTLAGDLLFRDMRGGGVVWGYDCFPCFSQHFRRQRTGSCDCPAVAACRGPKAMKAMGLYSGDPARIPHPGTLSLFLLTHSSRPLESCYFRLLWLFPSPKSQVPGIAWHRRLGVRGDWHGGLRPPDFGRRSNGNGLGWLNF